MNLFKKIVPVFLLNLIVTFVCPANAGYFEDAHQTKTITIRNNFNASVKITVTGYISPPYNSGCKDRVLDQLETFHLPSRRFHPNTSPNWETESKTFSIRGNAILIQLEHHSQKAGSAFWPAVNFEERFSLNKPTMTFIIQEDPEDPLVGYSYLDARIFKQEE